MSIKTQEYAGELIRKELKKRFLTNGYLIHILQKSGIEISEPKFQAKFTEKETNSRNRRYKLSTKL